MRCPRNKFSTRILNRNTPFFLLHFFQLFNPKESSMNNANSTTHPYGVRRRVAAFLSMARFLSQSKSGDTSPHSIKRLALISALFFTLPVFANDPLMDEGFVNGVKRVTLDREIIEIPIPLLDMTRYESVDRGIPDGVMKLVGYPLDMDVRATMIGGISIRNRYRWGLSLTHESTVGDGISDLVKMRPPGWTDKFRDSPAHFTYSVETNGASATPLLPGDKIVSAPPDLYGPRLWNEITMDFASTNFCFPIGMQYQTGLVYFSYCGALEFEGQQLNSFSETLPTPELSGDAIAVAWDSWVPRPEITPGTNVLIVAGFRGEQRGERYFFARWEHMEYSMYSKKPRVTFEGRLFENGNIEIHYLDGDFLVGKDVFSGAQCWQGYNGITIPRDQMVVSNKVTITQHYQLDPRSYSYTDDGIPDAWKLLHKINPRAEGISSMVFNDAGLTLLECFEQMKNPWTAQPMHPPTP